MCTVACRPLQRCISFRLEIALYRCAHWILNARALQHARPIVTHYYSICLPRKRTNMKKIIKVIISFTALLNTDEYTQRTIEVVWSTFACMFSCSLYVLRKCIVVKSLHRFFLCKILFIQHNVRRCNRREYRQRHARCAFYGIVDVNLQWLPCRFTCVSLTVDNWPAYSIHTA